MKTLVRLIRRYVLLAVGLSLLLIVLGLALIIWVGIRFGLVWQEQFRYSYMEIADQLQQDDSGSLSFGEKDASYWLNGYAWAMVLDDDGEVIWGYQLPQELDRRYTAPEIAVFSRWYLDDYPVFCQVRDYGLLVLGMPRDSIWKYSFWTYPELINWLFYRGTTVMGGCPRTDSGAVPVVQLARRQIPGCSSGRTGYAGRGRYREFVNKGLCRGTGRKTQPHQCPDPFSQ